MSSSKHINGHSPFPQKLRNFFRINSQFSNGEKFDENLKSESRSYFRQPKFFSNSGRCRSTTVPIEQINSNEHDADSINHLNAYYAHQKSPNSIYQDEETNEYVKFSKKDELTRKLRRVASAPNTQGSPVKSNGKVNRPATAELGKGELTLNFLKGKHASPDLSKKNKKSTKAHNLHVPDDLKATNQPNFRNLLPIRRTYSSNSIKVRTVEVGPKSFDTIKLGKEM